ncbi:chromate transporter [Tenuibacillus multivorans]|uniref:Chromate transporter n=1 Tax=Tenuibacillus multivorans TaxID=237069 RepID=A0A1H0C1M6_9BACI|nr:chromate transporter [Tenuibacillus multivorans]GEL77730.1 putative transporter YwrA [Tenuibacillus multivorans]SDN51726.1 chromate transporter [Tenuibacillus multivorans]
MKELWELFLAFFIPGIVGYGGGPASIPLVEHEVVKNYGFMTTSEFGEVLALANALPGPIATKMAGYIGFEVAGLLGSIVALLATVVPSLVALILLLSLLNKFKDSPKVKRMTAYVRPTIAVLLGVLTFQFFDTSYESAGIVQTVFLAIISFILLERFNIHPAFVVAGALIYGAIFLS